MFVFFNRIFCLYRVVVYVKVFYVDEFVKYIGGCFFYVDILVLVLRVWFFFFRFY